MTQATNIGQRINYACQWRAHFCTKQGLSPITYTLEVKKGSPHRKQSVLNMFQHPTLSCTDELIFFQSFSSKFPHGHGDLLHGRPLFFEMYS